MPYPFMMTGRQSYIIYFQYLLGITPREQLPFVLAGKAAYYRAHTKGTELQLESGKHTGARSTAVPVPKSSL